MFGIIPLLYAGLFEASTDMLPKRLALYTGCAILCLAWLVRPASNSSLTLRSPLGSAVGAYVLWSLLSLVWATNRFTGWIEGLQLVAGCTLFAAASVLNFRQHMRVISMAATLGGLVVSLIGIAQYLGLDVESLRSVGLPSSTFVFRNLAAAYLLGAIPMALLAFHFVLTSLEKNVAAVSLATMTLFLFYTRTRGAWIALAVAILLLALWLTVSHPLREAIKQNLRGFWQIRSSRWILLALAALVCLGVFLPARTSNRVIQQFDELKASPVAMVASLASPGGDRGRLTMWQHTLSMIADHPLFGVGLDNWEYLYPLYDRGEKITFSSEPVRPHNDLLWIAAELGLIGFALYLAILWIGFRGGVRTIRNGDGEQSTVAAFAMMGMGALIVYSLFSFPREQPAPALFFWFYLALTAGRTAVANAHRQTLLPLMGFLVCLTAIYMNVRNIQFDRHYQAARAYESLQRWEEANREIDFALAAGSFDHRARFLKGLYLQKMGKNEASAEAYLSAIQAHPNYAHSHHNLGGVYAARGNLKQAIPSFERALEIRPNYYQARIHLGNAYVATRQFDRAREVYEGILEYDPRSADALTNIGAVLLQQGNYNLAIKALLNALEIQPNNAQALNNLAYVYEQDGQISLAIATYESLLTHWQDDAHYRTTVENHLADLRRRSEEK
jgi:tetratricopeptide (TPR) repeat protein